MAICEYIDCKRKATHNYNGNPPILCKGHKDDDMVDISRKCIECYMVRASFNYKGEKKALYCDGCKLDGMINPNFLMCIECNKIGATFNYKGEKKGLYCKEHKKDNMVDVKSKMCITCDKVRASFNYKNEKKYLYCDGCKLDEMIDIRSSKCIECDKTQASFNYKGEKKALYCDGCKLDGMVNIKSKMCIECDKKTARCNYEGEKKVLYCNDCKLDEMINIIDKKCVLCNHTIVCTNKYKGYCLRCYIYTFPNNKISRIYKVKEDHVKNYIEKEFENQFIFDKIIDGGCSKRRPDAFKECGTHSLIIEVDEYQHKYYEEICENKRMMQLFGDLANRPIIFIRFNPDGYINKNNKKIRSSFIMSKNTEVPIVRNRKSWNNRLIKLKEKIEHNIKNIPEKTVTIINLFYDDVNLSSQF
jgi:EsV-1-7 cysteine-rich motif